MTKGVLPPFRLVQKRVDLCYQIVVLRALESVAVLRALCRTVKRIQHRSESFLGPFDDYTLRLAPYKI